MALRDVNSSVHKERPWIQSSEPLHLAAYGNEPAACPSWSTMTVACSSSDNGNHSDGLLQQCYPSLAMRGIQCVSPWPWPLRHHMLCYLLPLRVRGTYAKLPIVKAQRTWQMLLLVLSPHLRLHLTSWRSFIIFFFLAGSGETKCLISYGHKSLNAGIQEDKQTPHQQASRWDPKSAALIQPHDILNRGPT